MSTPTSITIDSVKYIREDSIPTPVFTGETAPFQVGKCYFIRTVTMAQVGRCMGVSNGFIILADAAWVADTGRFAQFLATGVPYEVEPFGGACGVALSAIVDFVEWKHPLLMVQK